jgi:hypothetical protein
MALARMPGVRAVTWLLRKLPEPGMVRRGGWDLA